MPRILRRPQAAADIVEIWDYIAEDSLERADVWVDRLDEKLCLLASRPMMGRARDQLASGLRSMPHGRYVVFYMLLPDGIEVVRVLHSARDIVFTFGEDPAS